MPIQCQALYEKVKRLAVRRRVMVKFHNSKCEVSYHICEDNDIVHSLSLKRKLKYCESRGVKIRGGPGNPLLASTFHDQTLEVSFTDALISTSMLGAMIGTTAESGGIIMTTAEVTATTSGSKTVLNLPSEATGPVYGNSGSNYTGFYRSKVAGSEWKIGVITNSGSTATMAGKDNESITAGDYCVKYFKADNDGETYNLNADFVPSVLHAISYIDVYEAGTAGCQGGTGTSTGRAVG